MNIVNNYIVKLDPDTISHRLIESVSMVTELLQSNRQLRDCINSLNKEKENIENDNWVLQTDNLELRDRIEILESIIKANANDYENYDWKKIIEEENDLNLSTFKNSSNKGIESIATSMVETKKENRVLKRRIEHLELQISHLTNQFDYQGNIEPTRTLMNFKKDQQVNYSNELMYDQSPVTYYDNENAGANYSNATSSQKMRSTGFSRGRSKINSKGSIRDAGRREMSMRNGNGNKSKTVFCLFIIDHSNVGARMLDEPLPPAFSQGSYSNQNNMMIMKLANNKTPLKDKDEAMKMLYNMMMNRVQKKRLTNY